MPGDLHDTLLAEGWSKLKHQVKRARAKARSRQGRSRPRMMSCDSRTTAIVFDLLEYRYTAAMKGCGLSGDYGEDIANVEGSGKIVKKSRLTNLAAAKQIIDMFMRHIAVTIEIWIQ